jgi:hypothetical protein
MMQGSVIVEPQVAAEPYQGGHRRIVAERKRDKMKP